MSYQNDTPGVACGSMVARAYAKLPDRGGRLNRQTIARLIAAGSIIEVKPVMSAAEIKTAEKQKANAAALERLKIARATIPPVAKKPRAITTKSKKPSHKSAAIAAAVAEVIAAGGNTVADVKAIAFKHSMIKQALRHAVYLHINKQAKKQEAAA